MNGNSKGSLHFASRLTFSIIFLGILGLYLGLMINDIAGVAFMIIGVIFGFFGNLYFILREIKNEDTNSQDES